MISLERLGLVMLLATALACGAERESGVDPSGAESGDRVTPRELAIFLDWHAELRAATRIAQAEATAVVARTTDLEERLEVKRRNDARTAPIVAREPFKGTRTGSAIRAVLQAFYATGTFNRDEQELAKLRASYGAELIDSIAGQEALFREKLP